MPFLMSRRRKGYSLPLALSGKAFVVLLRKTQRSHVCTQVLRTAGAAT